MQAISGNCSKTCAKPDIQSVDGSVCVSQCPAERPFSEQAGPLYLNCTARCEHEFEDNGVVKKCVACNMRLQYVRVQPDGSRQCVRECADDELVNVSDRQCLKKCSDNMVQLN